MDGHYTGHHQLSEWIGLDAGPQEAPARGGKPESGQPDEGHGTGKRLCVKVDFVDLRRDSAMSESELSPLRSLLRQFRSNIARPLQEEVKDLRMEIAQLRNAIQRIDFVFLGRDSAIPKQAWMALAAPSVGDCPHSADCPVRDSLQHESQGDS